MARTMIAIVVLATAAWAAPTRAPPVEENGDKLDPFPALCQLKPSKVLLGFAVGGKNLPVYQNDCSGLCLAKVGEGRVCQASAFETVAVYVAPPWYGLNQYQRGFQKNKVLIPWNIRFVRRATACGCEPKPCELGNGVVLQSGQTGINACREKCTCHFGQLRCCRVRKSITHMPTSERILYLNTLHAVSTGASPANAALKTEYDALIADHEQYFSSGIHHSSELLPWHRNFILLLENLLRKVDCRVTVPYWAWELDSDSPWTSPLWGASTAWIGAGSGNNCVPNGRFALPWTTTPSNGNDCLRRRRTGSVPTPFDVATLLATPAANYNAFNAIIDGMHGGVHCAIDGTMCTTASANAPEFFMHHGNMDRLWGKWQAQSPAHQTAFNGAIDAVMTPDSLAGGLTPRQMLDLANQPGGVCVQYAEPKKELVFAAVDILKQLPQELLLATPARPAAYGEPARRWAKVAGMDRKDMQGVEEYLQLFEQRAPPSYDYGENGDGSVEPNPLAARRFGVASRDLLGLLHDAAYSPEALRKYGLSPDRVGALQQDLQEIILGLELDNGGLDDDDLSPCAFN